MEQGRKFTATKIDLKKAWSCKKTCGGRVAKRSEVLSCHQWDPGFDIFSSTVTTDCTNKKIFEIQKVCRTLQHVPLVWMKRPIDVTSEVVPWSYLTGSALIHDGCTASWKISSSHNTIPTAVAGITKKLKNNRVRPETRGNYLGICRSSAFLRISTAGWRPLHALSVIGVTSSYFTTLVSSGGFQWLVQLSLATNASHVKNSNSQDINGAWDGQVAKSGWLPVSGRS